MTLTKYDKDIATFLGIFSLSKNFDCVLDILEAIYYSDPLFDRTGTRVGFVPFIHHWLSVTEPDSES